MAKVYKFPAGRVVEGTPHIFAAYPVCKGTNWKICVGEEGEWQTVTSFVCSHDEFFVALIEDEE